MADARVYWGTGKRKTAVARVRLLEGGEAGVQVNDRALEQYFGRETSCMIVHQPFEVTETGGQYRVVANVHGGGVSAQAVAIRHGITRALLEARPELRPALKKAGFITRDSREVERKKYGRAGARRSFQFSKR